jgi:hypothetical protein
MSPLRPVVLRIVSLALACCVGREALLAQEPFPDALRVDPLDDRNFSRTGVLPETQRLARYVEINCAELRARLGGHLPTRKTEAACLLPTALQEYTRALAEVAGDPRPDLDELERRLRTGAILDGRRTRAEAARVAARYFLTKAFLVSSLTATADLFELWFPVGSYNFFHYVFPQVNAALARGTKIAPVHAFLLHLRCKDGPCGAPRLAPVLAAAARPVAMVRVADSKAIDSSGFLVRSTLEPYALVLRVNEALARLHAAATDPRLDARFIEGKVNDPEVQVLAATVAALRRQLEAAACWVSTAERQEALAWIDGRAATDVALREASQDRPAANLTPGAVLVAAGEEARAASIEISDQLVQLRALLSPVGARP